jgi:hypothetical protein
MTKAARYAGGVSADAKPIRAETAASGQYLRDSLLVALTVASGAVIAISHFGLGKILGVS